MLTTFSSSTTGATGVALALPSSYHGLSSLPELETVWCGAGFQQADELGEGKAQTTGFAVPARAFSDPPDLVLIYF